MRKPWRPARARTGDGADDDDALDAVGGRGLDVLQQQVGQQEVAQVVRRHAAQARPNLLFAICFVTCFPC